MALKPCRECGAEVSTAAGKCPHCGMRYPANNPAAGCSKGCLYFFVVIAALFIIGSIDWSYWSRPRVRSPVIRAPVTRTDDRTSSLPLQSTAGMNDCEVLWAYITQADLTRDRNREAVYRRQASQMDDCTTRPSSVPADRRYALEDVPVPAPTAAYSLIQYRTGHQQCSGRIETIFARAGTRDPQRAAEWLDRESGGTGDRGFVIGCSDGLKGEPNRHPS